MVALLLLSICIFQNPFLVVRLPFKKMKIKARSKKYLLVKDIELLCFGIVRFCTQIRVWRVNCKVLMLWSLSTTFAIICEFQTGRNMLKKMQNSWGCWDYHKIVLIICGVLLISYVIRLLKLETVQHQTLILIIIILHDSSIRGLQVINAMFNELFIRYE